MAKNTADSGAGRDVSTMPAPMIDMLSSGKGIYTLTSCDASELSHEWDEKKQGVFSYYLAEALAGSCPPDARGCITADAVYEWVFDRVREWSRTHRCCQAPKRVCDVSGSVVLRRTEPDWRKLALELREQLDETQQELRSLMRQRAQPIAVGGVSLPVPESKPGIRGKRPMNAWRLWLVVGVGIAVCLAAYSTWVATVRYGWRGYLVAAGITSGLAGLVTAVLAVWRAVRNAGDVTEEDMLKLGILGLLLFAPPLAGGGLFGILALVGWLLGILGP